jgi:tRNA pseudouridine38-40 synthase
METRNIRLTVEYDGTAYSGWQKQLQSATVQGTLEDRLKQVCGHPVDLLVAGRTDSGVHGLGQTANFHTSFHHADRKIQNVLNHLLPRDIRVVKAQEVPDTFHATYHAKAKLYRYVIRNSQDHTVFDRNTYHHVRPAQCGGHEKSGQVFDRHPRLHRLSGNFGQVGQPQADDC